MQHAPLHRVIMWHWPCPAADWRPISSGVTGETYKEQWKEFPAEWFHGLTPSKHLARSWNKYDSSVNTYKVKCGGTLDMWESSGWISHLDPYGWFQWYCRFYLGRRTTDDSRQIARGLGVMGPGGRFRNQLRPSEPGGSSFPEPGVVPEPDLLPEPGPEQHQETSNKKLQSVAIRYDGE